MPDPDSSTQTDQDDQDDGQPNIVTMPRGQIRQLERKAKSYDEALARATGLERELAFARAGLPDDPKTAYFVKAYDGEMNAEAIRTAAQAAGFLEAPKASETPANERATHERMADAAAGGQAPKQDFGREIAEAKSPAEVMAIVQRAGLPTSWDR